MIFRLEVSLFYNINIAWKLCNQLGIFLFHETNYLHYPKCLFLNTHRTSIYIFTSALFSSRKQPGWAMDCRIPGRFLQFLGRASQEPVGNANWALHRDLPVLFLLVLKKQRGGRGCLAAEWCSGRRGSWTWASAACCRNCLGCSEAQMGKAQGPAASLAILCTSGPRKNLSSFYNLPLWFTALLLLSAGKQERAVNQSGTRLSLSQL